MNLAFDLRVEGVIPPDVAAPSQTVSNLTIRV